MLTNLSGSIITSDNQQVIFDTIECQYIIGGSRVELYYGVNRLYRPANVFYRVSRSPNK